ncbi:TPA: hypothetical protein QIF36_002409 [Enterobacter kobei]|nr:hypothetical protein [Enterobacter kobei]
MKKSIYWQELKHKVYETIIPTAAILAIVFSFLSLVSLWGFIDALVREPSITDAKTSLAYFACAALFYIVAKCACMLNCRG